MNWRVPLADLNYDQAERQAALAVLERQWLTMGQVTEAFEAAFAREIGVKHAVAVANATVGLHLANRVVGVDEGSEVIVPSLTFVATANAILYQQARPRFVEVTSETDFSVDPAAVEAAINSKTKAILVMHYAGYLCDMAAISRIAKMHGLPVIEDAAHAPGAAREGRPAGGWGDVGVFSFFSNKNLAIGEGGMLTTNRDDLAERLRLMRSHGMTSLTWDRHEGHAFTYDVVDLGYNYRIDELRSALGREQLKKLAAGNQRRREMTAAYRGKLAAMEGLSIPYQDHPGQSAAHLFPILLDEGLDRRKFMASMRQARIQTSIHYPPIHSFSYYRQRFSQQQLPLTESIGARQVTLPLYPGMRDEQIDWVVEAVGASLKTSKQ